LSQTEWQAAMQVTARLAERGQSGATNYVM
jgi:hypothetical protein